MEALNHINPTAPANRSSEVQVDLETAKCSIFKSTTSKEVEVIDSLDDDELVERTPPPKLNLCDSSLQIWDETIVHSAYYN
jgi:hypothetical protein